MNICRVPATLRPNVFSDLNGDLRPCYRVDFRDRFAGVARAIAGVVEELTFVYIFS